MGDDADPSDLIANALRMADLPEELHHAIVAAVNAGRRDLVFKLIGCDEITDLLLEELEPHLPLEDDS